VLGLSQMMAAGADFHAESGSENYSREVGLHLAGHYARWHQRPTKLRSDGGSGTISSFHRFTPHPGHANIGMCQRMKDLTWLADSRSRVKSFPAGVQDDIGYALYAAQLGEMSVNAKSLHGLGGPVMRLLPAMPAEPIARSIPSRLETRFT
jgi:hypothetical protein